jgi:hypothetical protein
MDKKICTSCNKEKLADEFYNQKGRKNGSSHCRECFNKYCIERWIQKKIKAIEYKGCTCVDCGLSYPQTPYQVFDFHHLNPKDKEFDWTKLRLRSWDSISKELDKCDLLCANCHRIRHIIVGSGGIEPNQ